MSEKLLCIYHGNCADGFGAAWAVRKKYPTATFHPGVYGQPPPDVTGADVVLVDFTYKRPVLLEMARVAKSILVLDHHKTAQNDLVGLPTAEEGYEGFLQRARRDSKEAIHKIGVRFDMARSGCMIAWDYFHPGLTPPALMLHIQDRDLWLFKLHGTREIQACVFSYPYDFAVWDGLMDEDVTNLRIDGTAIERKHHKDVAELIGVTKRRMSIGGHNVPVANLPYTLSSDAGHAMGKGEPFAACYWDTEHGRTFSLRSEPGGVDVSEVAALFGGGGHKNAAGFTVARGWEGDK